MTRVLVVEDEESFSDALAFMLEREGYEVAVAADGNVALEEFEKSGADILLLDLMLPGLPGTEVCRQIRTRSQVPIIMLTAKDGEVDKVRDDLHDVHAVAKGLPLEFDEDLHRQRAKDRVLARRAHRVDDELAQPLRPLGQEVDQVLEQPDGLATPKLHFLPRHRRIVGVRRDDPLEVKRMLL